MLDVIVLSSVLTTLVSGVNGAAPLVENTICNAFSLPTITSLVR